MVRPGHRLNSLTGRVRRRLTRNPTFLQPFRLLKWLVELMSDVPGGEGRLSMQK